MQNQNEITYSSRGSRNYCGVLNNPTEQELQDLLNYDKATYVCYSIEYAPTTGTKHAQFYMQFVNCIRIATLKQLNKRAHWEECKADSEKNISYVLKDETYCKSTEGIKHGYENYNNEMNIITFKEKGTRPNQERRLTGINITINSLLTILDQEFDDQKKRQVMPLIFVLTDTISAQARELALAYGRIYDDVPMHESIIEDMRNFFPTLYWHDKAAIIPNLFRSTQQQIENITNNIEADIIINDCSYSSIIEEEEEQDTMSDDSYEEPDIEQQPTGWGTGLSFNDPIIFK